MSRQRQNIDFNWKFTLSDNDDAASVLFDDGGWQDVDLPHDWSIRGSYEKHQPSGIKGGFLPTGVGWYRKSIHVPASWSGKCIYIEFDGIYMNSDVWVNGHHLGHRPYGYIGFAYELTPYLRQGANTIAVRVDCSKQPSSRWYNGSGIYRHVWLTVVEPIHIAHWGTWVATPRVGTSEAEVAIQTNICAKVGMESIGAGHAGAAAQITLQSNLIDSNGNECAVVDTALSIASEAEIEVRQTARLEHPQLWSPDAPVLYNLRTRLLHNGEVVDEYITPFGIRHFAFVPDKGFYLNGVPTKFKGVCLHHDAGPVGAAVPDALLAKRLRMLKEMGCNAVRTSHNPFAPEFYDLCDQLGLMVMDEAFDGWDVSKIDNDYSLYFHEWWQRDLGDMVRRDRNHPCVILWSIGNEVRDMQVETTQRLQEYVHSLDPYRPVTCGVPTTSDWADANRAVLDIAGYNDGGGACFIYERDHQRRPNQVFIATEAPHTLQTRGFYRTQTWWRDKNQPRMDIPNLTPTEIFTDGDVYYSSSYDNCGVRTSARDSWTLAETHPYLCGEFQWTGFDYLGESFRWPARFMNCGVIDLANLPKDHYYLYQSMWTKAPMIHLLPHWTHPGLEGVAIPVWVYTNCEEAELFLNGVSLGRQAKGGAKHLAWSVPYQPGELKAVGYVNGTPVAVKQQRTAGNPAGIRITPDKAELVADGRDVAQITFEIVDEHGVTAPRADNVVKYVVKGPAKLIGMENGDPLDLSLATLDYRRAFHGMGMGLVQATSQLGVVEVTAAAIVGERVFKERTKVGIAVAETSINGPCARHCREIHFTTDGSKPDRQGRKCLQPFEITENTLVRAAVYEDGVQIAELNATFVKGERPKAIDLTHGA